MLNQSFSYLWSPLLGAQHTTYELSEVPKACLDLQTSLWRKFTTNITENIRDIFTFSSFLVHFNCIETLITENNLLNNLF